ncbi:unnamed protein product [Durusdinium trenchii]|uniref:F-box domain-containing protein n=1 Tax=Durusdinium trenchii TaxID=1381693 RepID=A0ABP0K0M9_9DINO
MRCCTRRASKSISQGLVKRPKIIDPPAPGLRDLSEEVLSTIFQCLAGVEVLSSLEPSSKFLQSVLREPKHPHSLWTRFLSQEFPGGVDGRDEFVGEVLYRQLIGRRRCKRVEWRKVPHSARSSAGAREGSPGMFYQNGFIFVFGGWGGRGPRRDLHVTKLDSPMEFHPVAIDGAGPYPTYEAKVTVLDDRVSGTDPLRVLVTGGWCHGGYYEESRQYGLMEIHCKNPALSAIRARWVQVGSMDRPRANHSATFVPPRLCGAHLYPEGYVVLFGGSIEGARSSHLSLVDLSNFHWSHVDVDEGPAAPEAQNSHSATLLPRPVGRSPYGILVLGGGTGDDSNGGPPRGGEDCAGAFCLTVQEKEDSLNEEWTNGDAHLVRFQWSKVSSKLLGGRGHVAMRLWGTDTVVRVGGGKQPSRHPLPCAVCTLNWSHGQGRIDQTGHTLQSNRTPRGSSFGAGCALPDGLVLVYGGWAPARGTFSDLWAGCFDEVGRSSGFFQQLPLHEAVERDETASDDESFTFVLQRLLGEMGQRAESEDEGQELENVENDEDEDDEDEDDEGDEYLDVGQHAEALYILFNGVASKLGGERRSSKTCSTTWTRSTPDLPTEATHWSTWGGDPWQWSARHMTAIIGS